MAEVSKREQLVNDLYDFCAKHGLTSGPTEWSPKLFKLAGKPPYRAFGISIAGYLDGRVDVYSSEWILVKWSYLRNVQTELFRSEGAFQEWVVRRGWRDNPFAGAVETGEENAEAEK